MISGRFGVHLGYAIIPNDLPDPNTHAYFIDDCVYMAPPRGYAYKIDVEQVNTFIKKWLLQIKWKNIILKPMINGFMAEGTFRI